jgi:hypothetical protein
MNYGANERKISWFAKVALLSLSAFLLVACGGSGSSGKQETHTTQPDTTNITEPTQTNLTQIAKDAYLYALPAVEHSRYLNSLIQPALISSAPGFLTNLYSTTALSDANSTSVVSPNIDTYYSSGVLDIKYEPVIVTIPANVTSDRYYSIQLLDIFTNAWYISSSANDTAGKYLVASTDWNGTVPSDIIKVVRIPSRVVLALGRTQVFEPVDAVAANIATHFGISTLSGSTVPQSERIRPKWVDPVVGTPNATYDAKFGDTEGFFKVFNHVIQYQLLTGEEEEVLDGFEIINVGANKTFDKSLFTDDEWNEIENGVLQAKLSLIPTSISLVNGWSVSPQNAAKWGDDYLGRARAAWGGIYVNTPEEALYYSSVVDSENNSISGENNYTLTFTAAEVPNVKFFWSATLYKSNYLLFDNALNRYGIRSFDNITKEADGSFTLYIQNENPGADKEANWIPAPADYFRLSLRFYGANSDENILPPLVKTN